MLMRERSEEGRQTGLSGQEANVKNRKVFRSKCIKRGQFRIEKKKKLLKFCDWSFLRYNYSPISNQ